MSASRGVIRADDRPSFLAAWDRVGAIVRAEWPDRSDDEHRILVESFVPGAEFAVEGLLRDGRLHVFTIFDKPDPLNGPCFEETIYLTPSRAERSIGASIVGCVQHAATALGLERGPVHAEVRVNDEGAWLVELAARPIGGRCSAVLAFEGRETLEQVLIADALGLLADLPRGLSGYRGVMMIPTPRRGYLKRVDGVDDARRVHGVTGVTMTVFPGQELVPLPEGARYLGFIFAADERFETVDQALREAHRCLSVVYQGPA